MSFLEKIVDSNTILKLEKLYDKKMLANIVSKEEDVLKIIDYFKELDFDIKTLLINRLDVFLLDLDYIKKKIDNNQEVMLALKDDFSIFDELV